ncbi:RNA polymerase sigma factor SigJ [Nguyenibacter vanlangensis]|uniref:RNA polymerase sigma factor SigJ n=1 Tax=Nguyenibacter vanlangensis TaxID=1216886 RepID=A0ABZ3D3R8_9PROT
MEPHRDRLRRRPAAGDRLLTAPDPDPDPDPDGLGPFLAHRAEMIGLAYRMTGSLALAEDVAQDAFLRWRAADRAAVRDARSVLLTIAARLCLDQLRSARARREHYVGVWLPEPVIDDDAAPQEAALARRQDLSVAILLALQRLSPVERAIVILHDVFDLPFAEIAPMVGRSATACRKAAGRARARLHDTPMPDTTAPDTIMPNTITLDTAGAARLTDAFYRAVQQGDIDTLRTLLAEDAVAYTDGGGLRPAALNPIRGREKLLRLFAGLAARKPGPAKLLYRGPVNALPGYVTQEADGLPQTTALEWRNEGHGSRIATIYIVRNPQKLGHLAAIAPIPWAFIPWAPIP